MSVQSCVCSAVVKAPSVAVPQTVVTGLVPASQLLVLPLLDPLEGLPLLDPLVALPLLDPLVVPPLLDPPEELPLPLSGVPLELLLQPAVAIVEASMSALVSPINPFRMGPPRSLVAGCVSLSHNAAFPGYFGAKSLPAFARFYRRKQDRGEDTG